MKKKHLITAGSLALALAMSGLPIVALAHAEDGVSGDAGVSATVSVHGGDDEADASTSASTTRDDSSEGEQHSGDATSSENRGPGHATSTARAEQEIEMHAAEQAREHSNSFLFLTLGSTTPVFSLDQLKQLIENRKQELQVEASSSATSTRDIVEHASKVSVAVHALLASKDMLGGIGQEVSDIATQVNDSLATTTEAEAQIKARGFLTTLLFGGDSQAAGELKDAVAKNQDRITALTQLLGEANISADVKATLQAQITALEQEQTRLSNLANSQASLWGIFSWRF